MAKQAIIRVSRELLEAVLLLPPGARIVDVSHHLFFDTDEFAIKVESESFRDVFPGDPIPIKSPRYARKETPVFVGWDK